MKLWAMPCRATQDGWVMVESSGKTWSTGEGNGKPLQYSCLENPMNSMKRQKYKTLKEELPRLVSAQYATGDQWRNNSRKNAVHPKGDQSWGVHWKDWCRSWNSNTLPPDAKNWLIWNDPDAGKDWRREEKGMTEDEMVGWHHWLNGHGFEWTPGVDDGQGGLVCCSPWGRKELDMTERLNWTETLLINRI